MRSPFQARARKRPSRAPTRSPPGGNGAIGISASQGGAISASSATTVATSGGDLAGQRARRLRRQRRRRRVDGQSRRNDRQDHRGRGPRVAGERRGGQRRSRLDHDIRASQRHNDQPGATAIGLQGAGASIVATGGGTIASAGGERVSRGDEPDRDIQQFHHRQPDGQSHLRRPLHGDDQFQWHDGERRIEQA